DAPKRFHDRMRGYENGPRLRFRVRQIVGEALDIAVERDPDEFSLPIHARTSGVSSRDVVGRDEVELSRQVDIGNVRGDALGKIERRLIGEAQRAIKQSVEGRERLDEGG